MPNNPSDGLGHVLVDVGVIGQNADTSIVICGVEKRQCGAMTPTVGTDGCPRIVAYAMGRGQPTTMGRLCSVPCLFGKRRNFAIIARAQLQHSRNDHRRMGRIQHICRDRQLV